MKQVKLNKFCQVESKTANGITSVETETIHYKYSSRGMESVLMIYQITSAVLLPLQFLLLQFRNYSKVSKPRLVVRAGICVKIDFDPVNHSVVSRKVYPKSRSRCQVNPVKTKFVQPNHKLHRNRKTASRSSGNNKVNL